MNETSFRQGVRHLRLVLLMAIVGIMIASPLSVVMAQPPVQNTAVAPVVTLSATTPDQVFLGTSFEFTATFENEGTVTGYEPFIDLLIPAGVTVSASDITYLGTPVTSLGGEVYITNFGPSGVSCDTSSAIEHPAGIRQATGVGNVPISSLEPYYLCGPANTSVVTVVLPFGSFVPGQTAEIDVQATLSTSAGLDDLTIRSRAGFRRGETPADDPCCDPVIFEGHETSVTPIWKDTTIVDPTLVRVNKTITNAPGAGEDELVTGPNNPATYEIELTIAPGQTITNLNVLDMLPHNIIVTGITATGGTINPSITYPFSPDASDGDFNVLYANASGTYTIEVDFYIPIYENGTTTNVLNPAGSVEDIDNNLLVTGTWNGTTFDINDPLYVCDTTCDATYRFQAKPIAIQKSNDFNDIKVGDILTYTLDFQVSDYYGFRNIVITDTLGDGLQYVGNATLSIRGGSASTINPSNTPLPVVNGVTTIQYEIPGDLLGGCYPVDSSTDNQTVCTNGRAYGQIQFQARVLPEYSGGGWSGDPAIDQGDSVVNTVQISGDILNPVNDTPYGSAQDGSGVTNPVPYGQLSKAIVAVDRVATSNASEIEPGELVTYELAYTLPTTSFEPINVVDYLPLPAFEAVALTLNNAHAYPASTFPDEFEWSWSITPTGVGTFHGLSTTPTVSANAGSNALTFVFPAYTPPTAQNPKNFPSTLRIRFTLPVEYHDSADGMLLTNQAMVSEGSTGDNQNASSNIVQVDLRRPVLTVKKEMTGSENGLASLDAGDVVNFRLEIANVGGRAAYDVLIKDTIVYGFDPSSITNLEIRDGSGTLITSGYTRADGSPATPADLFANGIMLVDPNGGICHPATDPNNPTGNSMIVITYDLTVRIFQRR
jgi:fimbrial isopeptide formation D2 family protein